MKATMQAAILDGPRLAFRLASVDQPIPARGQVLVRIHASGVNPLDLKIRAGQAAHARHPFPAILGIDLAGTVEAVGPEVSSFREGDEIYGMTGGVGGVQGSLAEYAAVDAALLARKPANLSMREAAALPLIFITAWEGLVDRARVQTGQKVLIQGGAGGVGHSPCSSHGPTVLGCSQPAQPKARSLSNNSEPSRSTTKLPPLTNMSANIPPVVAST
jgi:NADPH:quinone reductase-like Zn-dependent oxidoreductase